ncbi:MAG: tetratricopeptide repeat protein [Alphaproteobacteria bacterium]|nr:tetratricopeptide repeat protein [Alphaproteobacteria bacterium]
MCRTLVAFLLGGALLGAPVPLRADQTDPRLPKLFETLRSADAPAAQAMAERLIWSIWASVEDKVVDQLMDAAGALMGQRELDKALPLLDRVVETAPDFAEGWNRRATLHYMMGAYDRSVADIQRTLALEPRHFGALSGLGLIYMALDNPKAALKAFEQALAINPNMPGTRANVEELKKKLKGTDL